MMWRTLRQKWWFWLGLSGGALMMLTLYAEWKITRWRGEARLAEAVAKLDADDPNWRAADLCAVRNAGLPPPDENSAFQAQRAYDLLPKSFHDWAANETWLAELQPGRLPRDADIAELTAVCKDCDQALAVARELRRLPRGSHPLVFAEPNPWNTIIQKTQNLRTVGLLLDADAVARSYQNRPNEALRSAHAALNTGRAVGDEPFLISQLVRIALVNIATRASQRTLSWGEPTAELAALQAAFAEELAAPRLSYGFRGERAVFVMLAENMDDGRVWANELPGQRTNGPIGGRFGQVILRKYLPGQQATAIDLYGRMIDASRQTGPARRAAFDQIPPPPRLSGRHLDTLLVDLLMPAFQKIVAADTRTNATLGAAVAALACERYRRKFGGWPDALGAIPKDILPSVPADPYTGTPLRYRLADAGPVVYATGPDLTDDGGELLKQSGETGTDIGFRLFNPDQRGKTPPPRPDFGDDLLPLPDGVVVP
jgi:hypothetical protein